MLRPIDRPAVASSGDVCERLGIGRLAEWRGEEGSKMTATISCHTPQELAVLHACERDLAKCCDIDDIMHVFRPELCMFDGISDEIQDIKNRRIAELTLCTQ
jgi:hypothetical protein